MTPAAKSNVGLLVGTWQLGGKKLGKKMLNDAKNYKSDDKQD